MTPSFIGLQVSSFAKSMTNGRDLESVDWDEHAVPIMRVDVRRVKIARGQEERNAAMMEQQGKPGLVHRDMAFIGRLRCPHNFDGFAVNEALKFASLR